MHIRNWMTLDHNAATAAISCYRAYWLRFNTEILPANGCNVLGAMLWVAAVLRSAAVLLRPILLTPYSGSTRLDGAEQSLIGITTRLQQSHRAHEHGQSVA